MKYILYIILLLPSFIHAQTQGELKTTIVAQTSKDSTYSRNDTLFRKIDGIERTVVPMIPTTTVSNKIIDENYRLALLALGSPFLTETVGFNLLSCNTSTALTDGQVKYTAVYLPKAATITGIKVYVRTQGSYTGDNENRVGLYTYSSGALTLVASSANSASLFTAAANAYQTIPFSATYAAQVGIYFVGIIYNNSAQTTAPTFAHATALNNAAMTSLGFTNSAKLYGTSNSATLPASINMSAITGTVGVAWIALY